MEGVKGYWAACESGVLPGLLYTGHSSQGLPRAVHLFSCDAVQCIMPWPE